MTVRAGRIGFTDSDYGRLGWTVTSKGATETALERGPSREECLEVFGQQSREVQVYAVVPSILFKSFSSHASMVPPHFCLPFQF